MGAILDQLGLDQTFFIELALFAFVFLVLSNLYFKPFLRLFEARHKRTVQDREAAEKLMAQAQARLEEYKQRLADERMTARQEYENIMLEAKKEETLLLQQARDESKKITQEAAASITQQHEQLKKLLEADVESLAKTISEKLLLRKV